MDNIGYKALLGHSENMKYTDLSHNLYFAAGRGRTHYKQIVSFLHSHYHHAFHRCVIILSRSCRNPFARCCPGPLIRSQQNLAMRQGLS